ncbi:protein LCHN-like [Chanos chanos]|uniref:DENN domain-containing protein 11 n=1 Tax=Chanos chanos TaxID=29144 RepID=A0A6J2V4P3_CHACN|nr:protein LCHN-like [Chanos chanos]
MEKRSDGAPLLDWQEDNSISSPVRDEQRQASNAQTLPRPGEADVAKEHEQVNWETKDQIVAVFVVTFDTRSGNMVEWCVPHDIDLDGVEFKSMASGSHRVSSDFIYMRKGPYFGLACFANIPVESEVERGVRMKSVGILTPSYTMLYHHMPFLENQVRTLLQNPGQYSVLEAFYEDRRAVLPAQKTSHISSCPASVYKFMPSINLYSERKITHPAGCVSQFMQFFGEQIMVLWKFALLRRRVLFFSPPPAGPACYRVYCCCILASVSTPGAGTGVPQFRPYFYVSVADIGTLDTELSFVACTTEKIFEEKKFLYDLYVDRQNVMTHRESLKPLLRLSSADKERYRRLVEQREMLACTQESVSSDEEHFILFFTEQNNRIFQTLFEVVGNSDRTLTEKHIQDMGLDPEGDHSFLVNILETYGIDVTLIDTSCC